MNWGFRFGEGLSDDRWLLLVRANPHVSMKSEWKREGQENKNEQHVVARGHREGTRSEPNTFDIQRQAGIHLQIEFTVQCWIIHEINDIKRVFGWDAPQSHGSVSESLTESQRSECFHEIRNNIYFKAFISILIFEIYPKEILMENENI